MTDQNTVHIPVLPQECISSLQLQPGMTIVDGTFGGGGHSRLIASQVGEKGRVIAIDQDPEVFDRAAEWMDEYPIQAVNANFRNLPKILDELEIEEVDGVLLDLGLSSDQLADRNRGFSFSADGELDLRFDPSRGEPAWRLINRLSSKHLADLIYQNSDERYSRRIAAKIVEQRINHPFRNTADLVDLVRRVVPRSKNHNIDPATRTMQALRIAVNDELGALEDAIRQIPQRLKLGGRFSIISFHSLEDRRVKVAFREDNRLEIVNRKPICASEEELVHNSRAKSAKLRVAEKMESRPV
ncbi:16S rRNA (cytosine(1402)-N(4))-methyltransferase RsmH [Pirellulaceae bacterium]|nr:16S rRNA (cytosine(1402)-N(4))-methyltransferase RsmH [Pirellulaceae bacterium]